MRFTELRNPSLKRIQLCWLNRAAKRTFLNPIHLVAPKANKARACTSGNGLMHRFVRLTKSIHISTSFAASHPLRLQHCHGQSDQVLVQEGWTRELQKPPARHAAVTFIPYWANKPSPPTANQTTHFIQLLGTNNISKAPSDSEAALHIGYMKLQALHLQWCVYQQHLHISSILSQQPLQTK